MERYFSHWIWQVLFVTASTLLIAGTEKFFMRRVRRRKMNSMWQSIFIDSLEPPLHVLIWLIGMTFAAQILEVEIDAKIFNLIEPTWYIGLISLIAWFLIRFVQRIEENILTISCKVDKTTADAIGKILRISILITATLVTLQTLGVSLSGVLAFGGIGGIAIGFAAKDLLSNFFGGFMLYLDRPFSVGDLISLQDQPIQGTVESIGWRLTQILSLEKRPLYVPNHIFATVAIENFSRMRNRRIKETIGIRYADGNQVIPILREIREMFKLSSEIDKSQICLVNLDEFGPSSLNLLIHLFTKKTKLEEFRAVKENILLKIHEIILSHGAEIAFPTQTIHLVESKSCDCNV
ncbi:MAG: mechanosensitive ion channel family protein [Chlamydiales bacterium]